MKYALNCELLIHIKISVKNKTQKSKERPITPTALLWAY